MLKGAPQSVSLDNQYERLKHKIIDYMHGKLSHEQYKALLGELTPSLLRLKRRYNNTILWWVVYSSFIRNPKIFVDVWNSHNNQLSHADFCDIHGSCGSPLWYLAAMANAYPQCITAYFKRFSSYIKIDTLTEVITVSNNYKASVFGLIAHSAALYPREFEDIWLLIKDNLSEKVLTQSEIISGVVKTPLSSLLYATITSDITPKNNQEKLNCSIVQFCFEQFGDLRPGLPAHYELAGDIIKKETNDRVQIFNLAALQRAKNVFFDELYRIKAKPNEVINYRIIIQLGRAALGAGYLNPGFQLAQHFTELNRSDYAYEALTVIPSGSIYQQNSINKCAEWYLSKSAIGYDNDKRLQYLTKALSCSLKISSETLRIGFLNRIAHLFIYGKELLSHESHTVNYNFLMNANDKTPARAILLALAQYKTTLKAASIVPTVEHEALTTSLDDMHTVESVQEQPMSKPAIPSMTPVQEYKEDPIPSLFNLSSIDYERHQISIPVIVQTSMTIDDYKELDELSTLMDTNEVMLLINPAIPYVKVKTANNKPAPKIITVTTPDYALPLAAELSDIDPLRRFYKR